MGKKTWCLLIIDVGQDGILRGGWQPPPFLYFAKLGSILKQAGLK
jgi:hypothetical protein